MRKNVLRTDGQTDGQTLRTMETVTSSDEPIPFLSIQDTHLVNTVHLEMTYRLRVFNTM